MRPWTAVVAAVIVSSRGSDSATEEPLDAAGAEKARVDEDRVVIDGTTIEYVTVVPGGFEPGDTAPVMLAFPPGNQDLQLTRSVVEGVYATQAASRGWVVVSPAAPGGQLYFNGSEMLVPGLIDWIETWVAPEGGGVHLVGVSNGGISAFRVAGQNPDRFGSILVFPGFPQSESDREMLGRLVDVPVRMFVGENDGAWIGPMEEVHAALTDLGGDVMLEVFPGEGHVIVSLSDGVRIFDELDALR